MRITLTAEAPEGRFRLPIHYNYLVQAALYNTQEPEFADFLHNHGYTLGKRVFRLFSFSRLMGKFSIHPREGWIEFEGPIRLVVTSPVDAFCQALLQMLLREEGFRLGQARLQIRTIQTEELDPRGESLDVVTLSPITVYSTLYHTDGRKFTYYYSPREASFEQLIKENLAKKYQLVHGTRMPDEPFRLSPLGKSRQHVTLYKGTVIKAHSGTFRLEAPEQVLKLALDASLGAKSSQGFGCIAVLNRRGKG